MKDSHLYSSDIRIDRVLHGLRPLIAIKDMPPVRWNLSERMEYYHVPGASLAIIDSGQIVWTGGFGVKKSGTADPVNTSTLFQAASISKPIAATAVLRLVDAGKISLDEDVNNYLKSWKIPENNYTVQDKVTLRRILSHCAGLTVHGFPGYSPGKSVPTLQQILDGQKPANTSAIRVDTLPGLQWRYSGGGFTVMQQLLIDMFNESFPSNMKRLVLGPAGMSLSTYEQPLPGSRRQEAASGHYGQGIVVKGNWHTYPEMAAAGLWTTPTELASWALDIVDAWNGRTGTILSSSMAAQMMTVQKPPSGLGVLLEGRDNAIAFTHGGGNEGFRCYLVMFPAEGKGAAMMTNANQGSSLIGEVFTSIAAEYHWPGRVQSEREALVLRTSQISKIVGTYTAPDEPTPFVCEVSCDGARLFVQFEDISLKTELYAASANEFFTANGLNIIFFRDNSGRAIKMKIAGLEATRQPED